MLHLVAKKLSKTFAITKSLFTFTSTKGIDPLQIADKMNNQEYTDMLKKNGFSTSEIIMALSIKENGVKFTECLYEFNAKYDSGEIDGFADSCIELLEKHYGKKLEKMKPKTIFDKVFRMQRQVVEEPEEQHIIDAINYYLSN